MEAPKCKICGERHYGPYKAFEAYKGRDTKQWPKEVIESETAKAIDPIPLARLPKFNKVAYQREYMRKRRAKEKN